MCKEEILKKQKLLLKKVDNLAKEQQNIILNFNNKITHKNSF